MNSFLLYRFLSIIRRLMKRKHLLITLLIGLTTLTGCHYAPAKVKYNDVTYINGWYKYSDNGGRDLHVCGILPSKEDPLFTKNKYDFWSTDEFTYPLLYASYVDATMWHPDVYISKDQKDEAQEFYQDKANYNYYLSLRFEDDSEVLIENESEKAILDVAIDAIMKSKKPKDIVSTKEQPSFQNLACFRRSKDGLFMTYKEELVSYKEKMYYLKEYNGSNDTWSFYDLGDAGTSLYSLFVNYNLIQ